MFALVISLLFLGDSIGADFQENLPQAELVANSVGQTLLRPLEHARNENLTIATSLVGQPCDIHNHQRCERGAFCNMHVKQCWSNGVYRSDCGPEDYKQCHPLFFCDPDHRCTLKRPRGARLMRNASPVAAIMGAVRHPENNDLCEHGHIEGFGFISDRRP